MSRHVVLRRGGFESYPHPLTVLASVSTQELHCILVWRALTGHMNKFNPLHFTGYSIWGSGAPTKL